MTHKALEEYFHLIINKPRIVEFKEKSMLDLMKSSLKEWEAKMKAWFTHSWEFKEEPVTLMTEDYWAFEMYTNEWVDENGETRPVNHTVAIEPHEGTWMEVLDRILDEMEKHYGYNIKEQVYYSVAFPLNHPGYPGYGRCLNDEVLQKLLLSFPEIYDYKSGTEQE